MVFRVSPSVRPCELLATLAVVNSRSHRERDARATDPINVKRVLAFIDRARDTSHLLHLTLSSEHKKTMKPTDDERHFEQKKKALNLGVREDDDDDDDDTETAYRQVTKGDTKA